MRSNEKPLVPPRLVAAIGLHGSASTWVFNVVRELMIAAVGDDQLVSCFADEPAQLPEDSAYVDRHLVIKSHAGCVPLDDWLKVRRARLFLSIRDPRDACLSMTQRFRWPLNRTVGWLMNDCTKMMRLAAEGHQPLRYEDRFFEDRTVVDRLADDLGISVETAVVNSIFNRYKTESVRAFAHGLANLPSGRITMVGTHRMDRVTQILGQHIGDTTSGKWFETPGPLQAELVRVFGPFLDRFGYQR